MVFLDLVACSSPGEPEAPPPIPDDLQFDASPETRSEIGIVRWGVSATSTHERGLRGYDAKHRMTVDLVRRLVLVDATRRTLETELRGEHGTAMLRTSLQVVPYLDEIEQVTTIEENTFADNPNAERTAERAEIDLASAEPAAAAAAAGEGGGLLAQTTLRPMDKDKGTNDRGRLLREMCVQLVKKCKAELLAAEKASGKQSAACRRKADTSSIRTKCKVLGRWFASEETCKLADESVGACDAATTRAIADAEDSGSCLEEKFHDETCIDPEGMARKMDDTERAATEEKQLRKQNAYRDCAESCQNGPSCGVRHSIDCEACEKGCSDDLYRE
jgi:hypothetical protein